jgi:cytochrome oxidase Cu insertion factor (SCO1/SenC/PrrC family)
LLRPDPAHKQALFDRMEVAVNYDAQGVNVHGIQLLLLDRHGRYVRSYHSVIWENAKVLRDLKQLLTEARS